MDGRLVVFHFLDKGKTICTSSSVPSKIQHVLPLRFFQYMRAHRTEQSVRSSSTASTTRCTIHTYIHAYTAGKIVRNNNESLPLSCNIHLRYGSSKWSSI